MNNLQLRLVQAIQFQFKYRNLLSFIFVIFIVFASDILFHSFFPNLFEFLNSSFNITLDHHKNVDLTFAPEIWGGVLAMVLGTLIIVIAIAAESTPKLMDLFVKDWISLIYVWFLIIASLHAVVIMYYFEPLNRISSVILNSYIYLFLASILAVPYIFYILLYSKTSNVVSTISKMIQQSILEMKTHRVLASMESDIIVEEYQKEIMGMLDQLDDLLASVDFKETQTEIIAEISKIIQLYVIEKPHFNPKFFHLTETIRHNATFRTYTESQYQEMAESQTFYEIKVFRLLGNAYIKMIENDRYDIASLIPAELVDVGKTCIKAKNDLIIANVNIRFNTLFRFAMKHAYKNNEPRNLYNLAFHYSNMIQEYSKSGLVDKTKDCYDKFKFYANDIYKNAQNNPSLYFIVDTLTFELRKCQVLTHDLGWSNEDQMHLLGIVLQLDNPPGYSKDEVDKGILGGNNGTRRIQIGLALFYLSVNKEEFAEKIALDYLDDISYFDEKTFRGNVETQCFLLSIFGPTFWEDTDRGNLNIYFAPEKDRLPQFKELIYKLMDARIEELERDVQYLALEVDKIIQKKQKQDGFLNDADKDKLEDLQRKISARDLPDEEHKIEWTSIHDLLYTLICIAFFADQEIDETEKMEIYDTFKHFATDIDENEFNLGFGLATNKFIELGKEEERENYYITSLNSIKQNFNNENEKLIEVINAFIDIANADDFIHENEIMLINQAINEWKLDVNLIKNDDNNKLQLVSN